ncbi:MAG: ribosome maturation factor RimP [candidate division Zixibacteria bacterium]|nr:ribosome maturation factor RimP [candidate division Zixibacteria bacterium]
MNDLVKNKVIELIEEPLSEKGCELADVVLSRYKNNSTLKIFVYSANGIDIDECARLSKVVGDVIDGTDLFENGYTLEVSSPGLDRPLKTSCDFKYRVGETVRVHFIDPKRKKITARIISVDENSVAFADDSEAYEIELADIEKAKIIY